MAMGRAVTLAACPCQRELSIVQQQQHCAVRRYSSSSQAFGGTSVELGSRILSLILSGKSRLERRKPSGECFQLWVAADSKSWETEEARWVREEQRWVREEQRWVREEARWLAEKRALQAESAILKNQVAVMRVQLEELRSQVQQEEVTDVSLRNLVAGMKTLLQALSAPGSEDSVLSLGDKDKRSSVKQITTPSAASVEEPTPEVKPVIEINSLNSLGTAAVVTVKEIPVDPNSMAAAASSKANSTPQLVNPAAYPASTKKSRALKTGMDGDDVKELQEALSKLGFYSGEEEIEFSMFSDGTESAVKTWQATIGVSEDGLVTPQLLAILLGGNAEESEPEKELPATPKAKDVTTPKTRTPAVAKVVPPRQEVAATRSSREIDRYERTNAEDTLGSQRRVYLLGENRWEEPGRLTIKSEKVQNGKSSGMKLVTENCFSCRGVGTMLCTDCEGTGDLNVEEQFLEWVGDEAKCPYCDGVGAVPCDVCDGTGSQEIKK